MEQNKSTIESLDQRVTAIEVELKTEFAKVNDRFDILEGKIDRGFGKIDKFLKHIGDLEDEQTTQGAQLSRLESRVEALEKTVGISNEIA